MGNLITPHRRALFSPDRIFRYELEVVWSKGPSRIVWIMLNPSTADEFANDPTIERCERRSRSIGYDGLIILNLFAFRSTDPKVMLERAAAGLDIIGPDNDAAIFSTIQRRDVVAIACGWGTHGKTMGRDKQVLGLIRDAKRMALALRVNSDGTPAHPLYLPYSANLIHYNF